MGGKEKKGLGRSPGLRGLREETPTIMGGNL